LIIVSISRAHHNHKQLTFINIDNKYKFLRDIMFMYTKEHISLKLAEKNTSRQMADGYSYG